MKIRLIITITLLLMVFTFALQNAEVVEIRFLLWSTQMSRGLLLFMVLLIGAVIGWFTRAMYRVSRWSAKN